MRFIILVSLICSLSVKVEACICFPPPIQHYFQKERTIIVARLRERVDHFMVSKLTGLAFRDLKYVNYQYKFDVIKSCKKGSVQKLDIIDLYEPYDEYGLIVPHFANVGDTLLLCAEVGRLGDIWPMRRAHGSGCNTARILNPDLSLYAKTESNRHYYLDRAFQLTEDEVELLKLDSLWEAPIVKVQQAVETTPNPVSDFPLKSLLIGLVLIVPIILLSKRSFSRK